MKDFTLDKPFKRRPTNRRAFTVNPDIKLQRNFKYFMQQELNYYNTLVENFNSRIKAFPQDVISIRDRDIKLLETCGQLAFDPEQLVNTNNDQWPEALKSYGSVIFDNNGNLRLDNKQLSIMKIGCVPANIHHQVRRNILSEMFSLVSSQAAIFIAAQMTEHLRAPVHMLQRNTWDTKHHLKIPKSLVEMQYNADANCTEITTPYNKTAITVM